MSKKILEHEDVYIAPGILSKKHVAGSPNVIDEQNNDIRLDPRNLDDKITIYEREVIGWFLEPASKLLLQQDTQENFNNGFVVLMVCMAYIEGVEQYKTGVSSERMSKEFFVKSFKRLFPGVQDRHVQKLYSKVRCGLFHNGMVKGNVIFNYSFNQAIKFEDNGDMIKINPKLLLKDIKNDFEEYIRDLREKSSVTTRQNFDRLFVILTA